jgi:hypothetical protein
MHNVAHHLQIIAVEKQEADRDIFARSAYNRYYYGVFLCVRQFLNDIDPKWSKLPHKDYPELLRGTISSTYKKARTKANKCDDQELLKLLDSAIRSSAALASLMEKASKIRVVADYEPSEPVNFSNSLRFSLKGIEITEAHSWDEQSNLWIKNIKQAWMQINV